MRFLTSISLLFARLYQRRNAFVLQCFLAAFSCSLLFSTTAVATPIPGAVVWFDANDFDGDGNLGNNPSIGTAVGTWVDKASAVQGTQSASNVNVAQQPLYANFQNGQHALNFTSTKILSTTSNVDLGALTYFVAFQSTGSSILFAERGANINNAGVYGEFLNATTSSTWRVKRTGGDSQKDYIANWGNPPALTTAATATFLFDGTNAGHQMLVNGSGVTLTGGTNAGTSVVSAQLNIGNRSTSPTIGFNGGIAELMAYDSALDSARVNIVNNYLSAKYATPLSVALDFYKGDDFGYDFEVFGIGREADGVVISGTYGNGLTIAEANNSLAIGDYLLAGIQTRTNSNTNSDLASVDAVERLAQIWYLDKTNPLEATLTFNLSDLNLTADDDTFSLLYRSGQTGDFSDLGVLGNFLASVNGNNVSFLVPNAFLLDGYYTLGISHPAPEPSALALLGLGCLGLIRAQRRRRCA